MQKWIEEEMAGAEFGDERLAKRAAVLLERLGSRPQESIPGACGGWAETMAAYRFFDNEKVTAQSVLRPHQKATERRMADHPVVLLVQDTTELDYTGCEATEGLGPLNWDERIGLFKHTTLAVTAERLCLGVMDLEIWGRREERERDRAKIKQMPIEAKESYRWIKGYRKACALAARWPQKVIVAVADREADIYEWYVEWEAMKSQGRCAEWIVRSCQDRRAVVSDEVAQTMRQYLTEAPVQGQAEVTVARSRGRNEQKVTVAVRAGCVRLRPPYRKGKKLPAIEIHAVWVREIAPPPDCEPLDWLLFTSLPVATLDEALVVVDYYCCRWQIELFFRVMKSGCTVEKLQLQSDARLRPAIALYAIIAWRVMYVVRLGRECPQLPCTAIFADEEWKALWTISKKGPLPAQTPSLGQVVNLVAALGGWLGRKGDGPPGLKTFWIGLQRTRDFAHAWSAFGPERTTTCV